MKRRWEEDACSRQRKDQVKRPRGESVDGVYEGPTAIHLAGGRGER